VTVKTAGVVLAGGLSVRMGIDKALAPLAGQPLIAHVAARLDPQVDALFVNANGDLARFRGIGRAIVADAGARPGGGPLAGVAAALAYASLLGAQWLATAPCDAPFLPLDLVARLAAAAERRGAPIGPFDLLIGAQARRRGATLVTANTSEFELVPGLAVVDWAA